MENDPIRLRFLSVDDPVIADLERPNEPVSTQRPPQDHPDPGPFTVPAAPVFVPRVPPNSRYYLKYVRCTLNFRFVTHLLIALFPFIPGPFTSIFHSPLRLFVRPSA